MDRKELLKKVEDFRVRTENVMNGKMGRTSVSWSVLFFGIGALAAIVQIIRSVLYFFS